MKYGRYRIKNKNKFKFPVIILAILILAFVVATIFWRYIFNNSNNAFKTASRDTPASSSTNVSVTKYILVQCGVFQNKDNATKVQESLKEFGSTFTIEEGGSTKVYLGIHSEEEGNNLLKTLKEKSVDSSRALYEISGIDLCNTEITEILNASLKIGSKLSEKTIKSIQTEDYKKWTSSLPDVDKNSKNYENLSSLKKYISSLPAEMSKDQVPDYYKYLYAFIKEIK